MAHTLLILSHLSQYLKLYTYYMCDTYCMCDATPASCSCVTIVYVLLLNAMHLRHIHVQ